MTASARSPKTASRRTVVAAVGALGLGGAVAACGSDDAEPPEGRIEEETPEGGEELAGTSDIPEGGGVVFENARVVVTQPEPGEFRAFSAVCTHQGCVVRDVSDGTINCACHGSRFAIGDGSVVNGPAEQPLPEEALTVEGDSLRLG
ncbi:Rieske (2Fe-2S) protein [Streptomyces sp. ACA25]|uniref:Rieske (2Fe-2S) protein n=1 Tax=Streptomyces sp. ACA25 TaxID=3022596 RepID=UPI00230817D8|nr:Rieske (2Fe-2S) protein [Streptomyces sp. ACA25]MDB1089394.1 Rieske (2Fe-2S) protein [Streptomyces sp. ACA25]